MRPGVIAWGNSNMPVPCNRLLLQLPTDVIARLFPHLEEVTLQRGDVLFRAHEMHQAVFFPVTAVISLVATLDSGATMEVGLVGRDGVAGIAVLPGMSAMPCEAVVQVPGVAYRIDAERLRHEAGGSEPLRAVIGEYVMSLLRKSMQMLLCQRFHSVKQRCVRRLVVLSELLGSPVVPLTHEQMAAALGARRPTITLALRSLERAGTIEEQRGRVTIRNRDALERAACECCRALMVEGTAGILV